VNRSARETFSQNVRKVRIAKGLSQEDLGELSNLHRNYIGGVERGERNISIDNMERIAVGLATTIQTLLEPLGQTSARKKGPARGAKG
jgi:transcriptional regulator with XRE-family HTH domain